MERHQGTGRNQHLRTHESRSLFLRKITHDANNWFIVRILPKLRSGVVQFSLRREGDWGGGGGRGGVERKKEYIHTCFLFGVLYNK